VTRVPEGGGSAPRGPASSGRKSRRGKQGLGARLDHQDEALNVFASLRRGMLGGARIMEGGVRAVGSADEA
jgi:hypothetical protein